MTDDTRALVDPRRILTNLRSFARIGYGRDGGITRLAFSQDDLRARLLLLHLMQSQGMTTRIDGFGNVFGRVPGAGDDALPPVLVGSHLDTVPGGGRFDGSVGIVAALELATIMRQHELTTRYPLEIVSFASEESSRFGRGTLGSGIVAGTWEPDEVLALRDNRGIQLGNVLRRLGLDPADVASARREPGDFSAYLEIHIEQGRVLEDAGARVGVVEGIAAPTRFWLRLTGRADHSGATPMTLRQDAMAGAAEIILAVERTAGEVPGVVGTVGIVRVEPGVMNVVPGRVDLGVDIRSSESTSKQQVVQRVREQAEAVAADRQLSLEIEMVSDEEPVPLDQRVVSLLEQRCVAHGYPSLRLPSGAGHDAMQMARLCPAGMVLVPSLAGVSHNRAEWTDLDDIVAGVQVIVDAALQIAREGMPS